MPYSDDEEHFPSEFTILGEKNDPNAACQGEDNTEQNNNKNSQEKVFSGLFYKVKQFAIQQSHVINPLINLACSVCTGNYCIRFLSHRPRSFVARSVRKTLCNTFPYRLRTRLISP